MTDLNERDTGATPTLLQSAIHGTAVFADLLQSSLLAFAESHGATWAAARCVEPDGIERWRLAGPAPATTRRALPHLAPQLVHRRHRGSVHLGSQDWFALWWHGADALLCLAWPELPVDLPDPDPTAILNALEVASLRGRVAGLEQTRRQLLERANHEVRNSLFTLRHTVELEARSEPADPRLDAILGRIRALFLTYSHLADSAFESTDARPLLEQIVPDGVDLDLGNSAIIIADRQTRWLAQALHELTTAPSAPVESIGISLEDDVVDAALRWRPGHRFDPTAEPVRWSIAEKLVCEGLRGRLDDTGEALHIRCFVDDLQVGGQVRQMPGGSPRVNRS